jgi:hypothetical protein
VHKTAVVARTGDVQDASKRQGISNWEELAIDPIVRRFGGMVRNGKWFVWLGLGDFWLTGAPRVGFRAPFDRPYGTGTNFGVDSPECASLLLHPAAQRPRVGALGTGFLRK